MADKRSARPLAISRLDSFVFGHAPRPIRCGRDVRIGAGAVVPEINFTLPEMDISETTWPEVRAQYASMIEGVCRRAVDLEVSQLLVEFETLPPMTVRPEWGAEIAVCLSETLREYHAKHGLCSALRLTPNDTREHERPPRMRSGPLLEGMRRLFEAAGTAGADLLSIESTGGKEICDEALLHADLEGVVYALGILGARDMEFLWTEIARAGQPAGVLPAGDSACGFANTAMVLAEKHFLPRVLAAVVRVAAMPRSLVAVSCGAVGPSKDCAYEGPYLKAIAGIPISMEGRTAACAHLSPLGNIAQCVCDAWSNESVQNVRLLSDMAPVVSLEQLAYDCRLLNAASASSPEDALRLRNWLAESDAPLDPQAYVLHPEVVLRLSRVIAVEASPYLQTRRAVLAVLEELRCAWQAGDVRIPPNEQRWLSRFSREADTLPEDEEVFVSRMLAKYADAPYQPTEYGLPA